MADIIGRTDDAITACADSRLCRIDCEIKKNQPDFALILQTAVNQAVIAAEQMMQTEDGQRKKQYAIASVQDYLAQKGMIIDVSVIEDAIEATVYSLHRENFFLTKEQREQEEPPVYEVTEEGHD